MMETRSCRRHQCPLGGSPRRAAGRPVTILSQCEGDVSVVRFVPLFKAVCSVIILALPYRPEPAPATPHVLVWANGSDVSVLNPLTPGAAPNYYLNVATMAFLTRNDEGTLQAELASTVPTTLNGGISADGRTITFHLRAGLRWSDGVPLTSADVAFSVAAINDPATNVASRAGFELIKRAETPDPSTIVFTLSRPYARILTVLFSTASVPVLPRHLLEGRDVNTADYMQLPVGAGPFRYCKWVRGDRVELERNPFYFRGRPKLDKIVFKSLPSSQTATVAMRTGEVDFWPAAAKDVADALADVGTLRALSLPGVRPQLLLLNWKSAPLGSLQVRSALRLALDRPSIIQRTYHGGATLDESIVAAIDPSYIRLPVIQRDVSRANALLDAAGWAIGADGIRTKNGARLVMQLAGIANNSGVDQIFELVRADWRSVGVDVETHTYVPSLYFAEDPGRGILAGGRFDAALFSLGQIQVGDLPVQLSCTAFPPAGRNFGLTCDGELDSLLAQYDTATRPSDSQRLGNRIQERISELLPFIVVVKRNEYYIARETITGFAPRTFSPFTGSLMSLDVSK